MDLVYVLTEEIKVREFEIELLKSMQRVLQCGDDDDDVHSKVEILLSGFARNVTETYVDSEKKPGPSTASSQLSEVAKTDPLEPYKMLEPNLPDSELCKETVAIIKYMEMGVKPPPAKSPSIKQIMKTPSNLQKPKEQTPLRMIGNITPYWTQTPQIFSSQSEMGYVCTPDIFQSKRPSPNKEPTIKIKLAKSENDGSVEEKSARKNPTPKAMKRDVINNLAPRLADNFLRDIKSPVEPIISFQFGGKLSMNPVPKQGSPATKVSPFKSKMNAVHSMMMYDEVKSPISPELTISLDRCRFK